MERAHDQGNLGHEGGDGEASQGSLGWRESHHSPRFNIEIVHKKGIVLRLPAWKEQEVPGKEEGACCAQVESGRQGSINGKEKVKSNPILVI